MDLESCTQALLIGAIKNDIWTMGQWPLRGKVIHFVSPANS
jgi:hypothetical protein